MKKFEHGGNIYNSAGLSENWLDMSANINPLGLSDAVKAAIIDNINGLVNYPDPTAHELKSAIATKYEVNRENIITLNGAAEFFYLFFNVMRPKRVLIPVPTFSEYERAALSANCKVRYFITQSEDEFKINFDELKNTIATDNIDCLVLANPNNPTGTIINIHEIIEILNFVEYVMVDESFIDFTYAVDSVRSLASKKLITVQSLTKFFAIPGLRLGFAVADKSLVNRLELGKDVWNVNYLAQKVGVVALNDEIYAKQSKHLIKNERLNVVNSLKKIPSIKVFKPSANFILMKFLTADLANELLTYMKTNKILLRSCANFAGLDGSYIRMAIRSPLENQKVINLIKKFYND